MISGVGFPSLAKAAVWSEITGAWSADFPLGNLNDLKAIRTPAVASGAGARVIQFNFPSAQLIDFFAFIHHNAVPAATFRLRLSAGADPLTGTIYDSGLTLFWPGNIVGQFPMATPHRLPAPMSVMSGRIDLASGLTWAIGGIEIGTFWEWLDVGVDRIIGVSSRSEKDDIGDADFTTKQWGPRVTSGQRAVVDQSEIDSTFLDFQRTNGLSEPFVWVWDLADNTTWRHQSYLARNATTPPSDAFAWSVGKMNFDFVEHLG